MVLSVKETRRSSPAKEAALDEAAREETVKLNARVPRSLRNRLKMRAIYEGETLTSLLTRISEEYLLTASDDAGKRDDSTH